jgi:hypothetical protein
MSNSNPNITTRFQPGNGHGGRQQGARQRLSAKFLQALADDFEEHGETVMQTVRKEDPSGYLALVAKLQPREVEAKLQIEQKLPGNLTGEEYAQLRRVVELVDRLAPAADAMDVFETIEAALRQAYEPGAPATSPAAPRAITHQPGIPLPMAIGHAPVNATLPPPPYSR